MSELVSDTLKFDSKQFYVKLTATLLPREAKMPWGSELEIKPFSIEVGRYNEIAA